MNLLKNIFFSRKAIYALVALILSAAGAAFPDAPLPSTELVTDVAMALLATHTLTDVAAILKEAVLEYLKQKKVA